jgi:hypothetical protein
MALRFSIYVTRWRYHKRALFPAASSKSSYRKRPGVKQSDQPRALVAEALVDRRVSISPRKGPEPEAKIAAPRQRTDEPICFLERWLTYGTDLQSHR